jgi:chromosomal replication initiation ATPase DnaA
MSLEELMSKVLGDSFTHYVGKDGQLRQRTEYQLKAAAPKKPLAPSKPEPKPPEVEKRLENIQLKQYFTGKYSFQRIIDVCCAVHGISEEELLSPCRSHKLVLVRRHVVTILVEKRGLSYLEIGRKLNRDHSTIIHAYNTAVNNPKVLNDEYQEILSRLENYSG